VSVASSGSQWVRPCLRLYIGPARLLRRHAGPSAIRFPCQHCRAFWMQTTGACQVGTTTAASGRCLRSCMRAVVRPCCCTSCCTDFTLTRQGTRSDSRQPCPLYWRWPLRPEAKITMRTAGPRRLPERTLWRATWRVRMALTGYCATCWMRALLLYGLGAV
jgi:hypothetical protein